MSSSAAFYCPFPSVINPHTEKAQDEVTGRWVGLMRFRPTDPGYHQLLAAQFGVFIGRACPNASLENLQLLMHYGTFAFLWDDQYELPELRGNPEKLHQLNERASAILLGSEPTPEDGALLWILSDLHQGLKQRMPQAWLRRFVHSTEGYFESSLWEVMNRFTGHIPSSSMYMYMRRVTVCLQPLYDLLDLAQGIRIPLLVRTHPTVVGLVEAASNAVAWANDVVSAEKESRDGDFHNLVLLLQREERLSMQEALRRVVDMHDAEVVRFIQLEQRLPSFGPELDWQVARFIDGLKHLMRANLDWSPLTNRYLPLEGAHSSGRLFARAP